MSLLGDLAKQAFESAVGGNQNPAPGSDASLLTTANGLLQKVGGVAGLMALFQKAGMGDKIASWVGTGHNLPISADQIKAVLAGHLPELAQQTGQSQGEVAGGLAQLLPGLIDHVTPDGEVPQDSAIQHMLTGLMQSGGLSKLLGA